MILCHKCSGLLHNIDDIDLESAIGGCKCISSYIRDFQTHITAIQAIKEAIESDINSIRHLSARNSKDDKKYILEHRTRINKLLDYLGDSNNVDNFSSIGVDKEGRNINNG